ncbi:MAG: polyprenyl synthetase [Desulfobulbus propionicus]|nr:MAG: polyprenyl synthetase [Desulfobulbus propionicus]
MNTIKEQAAAVNTQVESAIRADLEQTLRGCDSLLQEIINYAVFSGGKRIRPFLVTLCSRLCGRDDIELYRLASGFEYLHVASLIHDDIIDNAQTRRGRKSLVAKYSTTAAILAGDWLLSRSMYIIGELCGHQGLAVFCRATEGMVDGEFLQLRCVADPGTTEEQYFQIIRCKTGNLISSTCTIGAIYAGASEKQQEALYQYGDNIGAAFQVIDDLLDYQGDAQQTGKAVGNDFIEGKLTLPLIHTLAQAHGSDKQRIGELINGDRTQTDAYEQLYHLMEKYDGFTSARTTATQLVQQAEQALEIFSSSPDQESLSALHAVAQYILHRNR